MTIIKIRGGTTQEWADANPVLASRELGTDTDTGQVKVGDDVTPWLDLPDFGAAQVATVGSPAHDAVLALLQSGNALGSAYVTTSRNLFNPLDVDVQPGFTLSTFAPAASAAYTLTGFIPVTPGLSYTMSNPRNWAFYNSSKVGVAGSAGASATSSTSTVTAPAGAAYLRASFLTATYSSTFQVEQNATATAYVPYSRVLSGVTIPEATLPPITPAATSFAVASKNLADPNGFTAGQTLNNSGAGVASATYTLTGYIPVVAGQAYTLSNPRNAFLYNSQKAASGSIIDNAAQGNLTITPTQSGYLRASFNTASYSSSFQIEKGAAATSFVASEVTIPQLAATSRSGAMRVVKSGSLLTVTTDLGGKSLVQTMSLDGSSNGAFNWLSTSLDGVLRHGCSDSITPLRTTMGTIGANHGFSQVRSFTNPDGKTTADLGSKWTDGTTVYTLLQIDSAGKLVLGGPATTTTGATSTNIVAPVANLTHVSGATHTGTILISTISSAYQLYPSIRAVKVTATLDGGAVPTGRSDGQVLRIVESYEILDYADLITKAQANIGTPYTSLTVNGALRIYNVFEMRAPGAWLISTAVRALTTQVLGQCGFVQSEAMTPPAGGSLWRWVPGINAVGGLAWHTGVDITGYSTDLLVAGSDLMDATKPPTWMMEWARDSAGADVLGFAHGYFPDKTDGSWAARVASAPTNYWDLRGTKKSYPTAMTTKAMSVGDRVSVQSFRNYLDPAAPNVALAQDAADAYGFVRANSATALPAPLPTQLGKEITPLVEQGLTVRRGTLDAAGLVVTGTGAAVTRLQVAAKLGAFATGSRPTAASAGAGASIYDTTLSKPIYSDGTVWRDAAGTAV